MNDPSSLPPPSNDTMPPRRAMPVTRAGFLGGLVGGLAIAVLAGAVIFAMWPSIRMALAPAADNHETALAELDSRVAALEKTAGTAAPAAADVAALTKRVEALEQAPRATPVDDPRIADLVGKVSQLTGTVAALHPSANEADLQALVSRAEAAAQSAHDAAAKRQSAEAMLLVVGQLRDAVERGGPYAAELSAARRVAPPDAAPALDALAAAAEVGVTPRNALIDSFPAVASAITRAAFAADSSDDFWSHVKHEAATLVSVRRTDGRGSDPASIAARAEKAARNGDLEGAVKELATLDGAPAAEAKEWVGAARARLNAEKSLSDVTAKSAASLAPTHG